MLPYWSNARENYTEERKRRSKRQRFLAAATVLCVYLGCLSACICGNGKVVAAVGPNWRQIALVACVIAITALILACRRRQYASDSNTRRTGAPVLQFFERTDSSTRLTDEHYFLELNQVIDSEEPITDYYEIQKKSKLGEGSYGSVYKATQQIGEEVILANISIVSDMLQVHVGSLAGSSCELSLELDATIDTLKADIRRMLKPSWVDICAFPEDGKHVEGSNAVKKYSSLNLTQDADREFAAKVINRRAGNERVLVNEIVIMKKLNHPNVVNYVRSFADTSAVYLVMELCSGGELFDRIISAGHFTELQSRTVLRQLLGAVEYCHNIGVCHRCPKPEDILFKTKEPIENNLIKLCDFGHAIAFTPGADHTFRTKLGTPYYVAPQILAGNYDESCALWSCGVILYVMLCGYPPFFGESDAEVLSKVRLGNFSFNAADWRNVSDDAKNLIRRMLKMSPRDRCTATEALNDRWLEQAGHAGGVIV